MKITNNKKYKRKLSLVERYSLVLNENYRYNVEAFIEGEGDLDPDLWRRAVHAASEANPGVRVRLKSFLGFAHWEDSGIAPEVRVIENCKWDAYSEVGSDFVQDGFTPISGGPIAEVVLMPGSPAKIMFRALHAAMDARGMHHWVKDIHAFIRNEPLAGSTSTITDMDVIKKHADKVKNKPEELSCLPALPVGPIPEGDLRYVWRRIEIGKCPTYILPKIAIFLSKQARLHGMGDTGFTVPVDFRTLRADSDSTGNLTGYLRVRVDEDDSAKSVMRRINQGIRDYADCYSHPGLKIIPWVPIKILLNRLKKGVHRLLYETSTSLPTAGIVSMGLFNKEELSYSGFTATKSYGIPGSVGKLNVLIMNDVSLTQVIFTCPSAYNTEGQLDSLIEDFRVFVGDKKSDVVVETKKSEEVEKV